MTASIAEPAALAAAIQPPTIGARLELYETLTTRERGVAKLLAFGLTCHDIAEQLGIDVKTADSHRNRVLTKLCLRNTAELARDAIRVGFVPAPDEQTA
jgi:DNA-binding NarL/FixJ family response regulator